MRFHPQTIRPLSHRLGKSLVAASLGLGLVLLAGCGGDDPATTSSSAPSAAATPSSSTSAASSASPSASASSSVKASTNLDALTVTGAYGKQPTVKIAKTPWVIDKTRSKVLSPGSGAKITAADSVLVDYYGVDARTGKVFDQSFESGQPVEFPLNGVVPGFKKGLVGQQAGSRVVIAMPGSDGYDASGGNASAGINVGDTLVFVVDIVRVPETYTEALTKPTGTTVTPKSGLPTVSDSLTAPTISAGPGKAPTKVTTQVLIRGKGTQVTQNSTITVHYAWQTWKGKKVETNFGKDPETVPVANLVPGLNTALVGQTVGSRVMVVVPYATAYPDTAPDSKLGISKSDTLVFVFDILFAETAQAGG